MGKTVNQNQRTLNKQKLHEKMRRGNYYPSSLKYQNLLRGSGSNNGKNIAGTHVTSIRGISCILTIYQHSNSRFPQDLN